MGVAPEQILGVDWGECVLPVTPPPPALAAEMRRTIGAVPGWAERIARSPWVSRFALDMVAAPVAYIEPTLYELIGIVVSQDNSCRYCYGVQRAVLKIHGYRDEYLERLLRDFRLADLPPADRAALEFARRVSRAEPRPGRRDFEALAAAGLSREAAAEVAAVVAAGAMMNRVMTLLALPAESLERVVQSPFFRLIRPLMAWRMRPRRRSPRPPPPNDGPCAPVIAALGGSPTAGIFRRTIDGAWASPVLPRRTKALMLAVIAKALRCPHAEAEVRGILAGEGFAARDLDDVLGTLSSSKLDAREARLVPFARDTVRYQPGPIQRRFRAVTEGFGADEVLEAAGVAALGNAVCRLSVVLDAC